jgi:hypothetical protein
MMSATNGLYWGVSQYKIPASWAQSSMYSFFLVDLVFSIPFSPHPNYGGQILVKIVRLIHVQIRYFVVKGNIQKRRNVSL